MNVKKKVAVAAVSLGALLASAAPASAAEQPAWDVSLTSQPTNFAAGASASGSGTEALPEYTLVATNVGGKVTSGTVTVTDTLPVGLKPAAAALPVGHAVPEGIPISCGVSGQTITCTSAGPFLPGGTFNIQIPVDVKAGLVGPVVDSATVSGGGALAATAATTTTVSSEPAPFGFLAGHSGLSGLLSGEDGGPVTQAGSHPYQLTVDLGLATSQASARALLNGADRGVRDITTTLPKGLVVDPGATPVRCTEAQLESSSCPDASQVGIANVTTLLTGPTSIPSNLYNMVTPRGTAALFGFNAIQVGIFVHLEGGVRAGDYRLQAAAKDLVDRPVNPVLGTRIQLWGDPSGKQHDGIRGEQCRLKLDGSCPVAAQMTPLLTLPTSCGEALTLEGEADSWGHPGVFAHGTGPFSDAFGNPTEVSGCNAVPFVPKLHAQPTTNVADSPTGLNVDLEVPQSEQLNTVASAHLKKAVVTLPEGLVLNPSGANGLDGCSEAQLGMSGGVADGSRPACPDASRIGSVEVDTPLLEEPLPGSVYVAKPFDNPFDSLLAIYAVVDDPQSGTVIKLAGHVVPDPETGRLLTTFDENPQLPFDDFKLSFFGGATAALRSPAVCGKYTTTSDLTPWSAPEGKDAHPSDSFQTSVEPGGGSCPTSAAAAANSPGFEAGTVSPQAAAYSPFLLKLNRNDGSQPLTGLDMLLPPGLSGKLAGIAECPDSALAAAAGKSGRDEQASPSCPASSQVGVVTVGAGAGPTPYYTQGTVYLAGPYKGAPLSLAIVTPAVAGPYDLGTVVVRAALYVDPITTQIHAVSDPFPTILQGIPLDLRSVSVRLDRDQFTLNPTSCDRFQVTGTATSSLGATAALSSPFQVGGCSGLGFKPTLKLAFKGGTKRTKHPALKSVLTFPKSGDLANVAKAVVTLPHSEIIDQTHVGNPCTRPQFAAGNCPKISVLGTAKAWSPLLDNPLEGNVYFRSNGGERDLPDIVADLRGKIHVELIGAVDTATPNRNARIRTTFFSVPDAPVSRFELQLKGGKEGLLVNSENICRSQQRAVVELDGHNGAVYDTQPEVANQCAKGKKNRAGRQRHAAKR